MSLYKNWKIIVLLVALATQGIVINRLIGGGSDNVIWQIAGEVPEPGSIILLAFGSLWLRNENHKNSKRLRY